MEKKSKHLLVGKTEFLFNKKKLQALLNSAKGSNVVLVSIKDYNVNNELNVSYEAAPNFLNTTTGEITPTGGKIIGSATIPCPYPPGCNPAGNISKAKLISCFLDLEEKKRK